MGFKSLRTPWSYYASLYVFELRKKTNDEACNIHICMDYSNSPALKLAAVILSPILNIMPLTSQGLLSFTGIHDIPRHVISINPLIQTQCNPKPPLQAHRSQWPEGRTATGPYSIYSRMARLAELRKGGYYGLVSGKIMEHTQEILILESQNWCLTVKFPSRKFWDCGMLWYAGMPYSTADACDPVTTSSRSQKTVRSGCQPFTSGQMNTIIHWKYAVFLGKLQ